MSEVGTPTPHNLDKTHGLVTKNNNRCISHMEIICVILKHPEVVTNPDFVNVSTFPLELRAGIRVYSYTETEYGAYVMAEVEAFRRFPYIDQYRLHTKKQLIILDYIKLSKLLVDNITLVDLRPPEPHQLLNKLGDYYHWFLI